jgi:hypothetical protein
LHRFLLAFAKHGCRALAAAALAVLPLGSGWPLGSGRPLGSGTPIDADHVQEAVPIEGSVTAEPQVIDPRTWMPLEESLRFKVEVTMGPVRGLDVGKVTLQCTQAPLPEEDVVVDATAGTELSEAEIEAAKKSRLEVGTIKTVAKGGYLGYEVLHTIVVKWYAGTLPRIEWQETMRGSNCSARTIRIGEIEGQWKIEYQKDRHCKGCNRKSHQVDGMMPWSDPRHCKDCERPEHRVPRDFTYLDIPADSIDMVSSLYFARSFVRSGQSAVTLNMVNQDELWSVELKRGEEREIETPAGDFDCVRVLIGPKLAAGEGLGDEAEKRFEALFGLHGNITIWVDKKGGFPVRIEGEAPFGPVNVAIKASLTDRDGG